MHFRATFAYGHLSIKSLILIHIRLENLFENVRRACSRKSNTWSVLSIVYIHVVYVEKSRLAAKPFLEFRRVHYLNQQTNQRVMRQNENKNTVHTSCVCVCVCLLDNAYSDISLHIFLYCSQKTSLLHSFFLQLTNMYCRALDESASFVLIVQQKFLDADFKFTKKNSQTFSNFK